MRKQNQRRNQMKYTLKSLDKANSTPEFRISFPDLKTAFANIPDPRRKTENKRYELSAILLAVVAAFLSQQKSILGVAEWLQAQQPEVKSTLGFTNGQTPNQSTFQRLLSKLNIEEFEKILTTYFDANKSEQIRERGSESIAIDGKSLRGKLKFEEEKATIPVHLISLYSHDTGQVLAQTDIKKGMNEISTAPNLIDQIDWRGRVLTGDAAFCQKEICKQVVKAGGDYLLVIKGNQQTLLEDAKLLFEINLIPKGLEFDIRECKTIDKGHGRIEIRKAQVSNELHGISNWPYLNQVLQINRKWVEKGINKNETSYAVTSLPEEISDVMKLTTMKRGHWGIENRLHWVKDVVLGEDKSLIHSGSGPYVLAALRNTALNLLRKSGFQNITSRLRFNSSNPQEVLKLLQLGETIRSFVRSA